ncbi:MAG: hypothetical protein AAGC60_25445 [Acidobacteriota bacterium]
MTTPTEPTSPRRGRFDAQFPAEIRSTLQAAVQRLREKVDAVYEDSAEHEKMADLHYFVHELVDQQMGELAADDPELEHGALLDLREQVARYVHRLIEDTRRA